MMEKIIRDPYIHLSHDEGQTWVKRRIKSGNAGYSSLAILKDGSIGILAEIGNSWNGPIYFMRTDVEWISSNKDHGPYRVSN